MERSTQRVLTTHTGSLPRVATIADVLRRRERDRPEPRSDRTGGRRGHP